MGMTSWLSQKVSEVVIGWEVKSNNSNLYFSPISCFHQNIYSLHRSCLICYVTLFTKNKENNWIKTFSKLLLMFEVIKWQIFIIKKQDIINPLNSEGGFVVNSTNRLDMFIVVYSSFSWFQRLPTTLVRSQSFLNFLPNQTWCQFGSPGLVWQKI